jgi:hypothetical protein
MRPPQNRPERYLRLLLTSLEDRSLPTAGLSESLAGGVLKVTDWRAADTITIHQTTTGVTVDAGTDEQSFAGVNRVNLDVQYDASVTNDVSGLKGAGAREVYLARRDPTGTKFAASGDIAAGATSGPGGSPVTPPPPPSADWFDAGISDPTLRTLARSLAADNWLTRGDWWQIFTQVEKDGTVSAGEFHDLQDLLYPSRVTSPYPATYGMPDPVWILTSKIVDGNSANATYQGAALGNLHAGSSTLQLQLLVGKWFLGTDHPAVPAGINYRLVSGNLFVGGASYSDVVQGQVGDCYFVAALAGVARFSPQTIQQMAIDNGDGTFTIRFFNGGYADYVTVDRYLPIWSDGTAEYASFGGKYSSSANELWVSLIEKAYVQISEEGWLGHAAVNSYANINTGYSDLVISELTGRPAGWTWLTNASPNDLIAAINAGKSTVLASKQSGSGNGVIDAHGYSLVGYNAANGLFTLYNPWGCAISLSWGQLVQSFNGFWN